jgi:DNA invertase Pin-like site-specific DNA recombinase
MGAFAEFERALIHERQREGIALAKQRGVYKGRKKALSAAAVTQLRVWIAVGQQGQSRPGISPNTIHLSKNSVHLKSPVDKNPSVFNI